MPSEYRAGDFSTLVEVIARLRAQNGCPWDQKQTPITIKKYLLEETDELVAAILEGNSCNVQEEIGDLFFILILLIQMYEEDNKFTTRDVIKTITEKMIRRHPHVFSDAIPGNEDELRKQWKTIKAIEKNTRLQNDDS